LQTPALSEVFRLIGVLFPVMWGPLKFSAASYIKVQRLGAPLAPCTTFNSRENPSGYAVNNHSQFQLATN